jgi:hypothetical protein
MTSSQWLPALPVRRRQSTHLQASVATLAVAADEVTAAVIGPVTALAPAGAAIVVVIAVIAALAVAADKISAAVVVSVATFAPVSAAVVAIAVVAALALAADQVTTTVVVVAAGLTLVAAALARGAAGGDAQSHQSQEATGQPCEQIAPIRAGQPLGERIEGCSVHGGPSFPSPSVLSTR